MNHMSFQVRRMSQVFREHRGFLRHHILIGIDENKNMSECMLPIACIWYNQISNLPVSCRKWQLLYRHLPLNW